MDRIRQALGEKKISYWGQSYGTYLGAVYRSLTYLTLAHRLDRTPAAIPGASVPLDGALLRNMTYALLLHDNTLPVLAKFWKAAGDLAHGSTTAADTAVLKEVFAETPTSPGGPADNQATMFMALTCGDAEWPHDVDGYATRTTADREKWPLTAGMPANIWACAFWNKPAEAPVSVVTGGPRNTLILQNRRDNATPWESGVGLHKALGDGSVFVGVDNGGHYVYNEGSACADKATVGFLATGHLPDKDACCTDVTQK